MDGILGSATGVGGLIQRIATLKPGSRQKECEEYVKDEFNTGRKRMCAGGGERGAGGV
jgi:hypothetical protein